MTIWWLFVVLSLWGIDMIEMEVNDANDLNVTCVCNKRTHVG